MWGSDPRRAARRRLRRGVVGASLAALVALPLAGEAAAAPGSTGSTGSLGSAAAGSSGSAAASSDNGSVTAGSVIPGPLQNEHPPLPPLRDDIAAAAITGEEQKTDRLVRFTVASPALRREVGVEVLLPKDNSVPRPSIYALEGVDAREDTSGWVTIGGAPDFFADKNVNVVMINGGVSGMYTDWDRIDPGVGLHKWETFITQELPTLLDARLNTNGVKSLLGISMGSQGAMMLAHRNPGMYRGIAVFSGCYSTVDDLGRLSVQSTVSSRGGDIANVWGEVGGRGGSPTTASGTPRHCVAWTSTCRWRRVCPASTRIPRRPTGSTGVHRRADGGAGERLHPSPRRPPRRIEHPGDVRVRGDRHPRLGVLARPAAAGMADAGALPRPSGLTLRTTEVPARRRARTDESVRGPVASSTTYRVIRPSG